MAFRIQTALITNTDGAAVPRAAVRAHFLQLPVLGHDARAADIEMIPDGAELALAVTAQQVFYREIPVLAGGRTVDDDILYLLHIRPVLDVLQKLTFAHHLFISGEQWKGFFYHGLKGNRCAAGDAQGGEGGDCRLNNGLEYLLPRDFIIFAHNFKILVCNKNLE